MPSPPEPTPEQLFLAHLSHIERVATHACRRRGFSREDTEEFVSTVKYKLIEDDYAIIRKFQGKSSFETYITVVIRRLFLDHLDYLKGKWRPSAEAERLGDLAVQLDQLLHRDGLTLSEACETLLTNHHVEASRQELEDLAARLPHRSPRRRTESEESLEDHPAEMMSPEQEIIAQQQGARRRRILELLKEAMGRLPAQDALLARMSSEFKISQIARTLKLEQKPLYRRLDRILLTLREDLEGQGVRPDEIGGLLARPQDEDDEEDEPQEEGKGKS